MQTRRAGVGMYALTEAVGGSPAVSASRSLSRVAVLLCVAALVISRGSPQSAGAAEPFMPPAGMEVEYQAAIKSIAERAGQCKPVVQKHFWLGRTGLGEEGWEKVTSADKDGVTLQIKDREGERTSKVPWARLSVDQFAGLLDGIADPKESTSAGDCIAAGMLALARGKGDVAYSYFSRAGKLDAKVARYMAPLAKTELTEARQKLEAGETTEALAMLTKMETKYPSLPDALRNQIQTALTGATAAKSEELAKALIAEGHRTSGRDGISALWDLKLIADELASKFSHTKATAAEKAALTKWTEKTATLGDFIIVQQEGEGAVKTIGDALRKAKPKSLIQIEDDGLYNEMVAIPKEMESILIRGKKGCWPVITSLGENRRVDALVKTGSKETVLERMILAHTAPPGPDSCCIAMGSQAEVSLHLVVVWMRGAGLMSGGYVNRLSAKNSLLFTGGGGRPEVSLVNSVWTGTMVPRKPKLQRCTVIGHLTCSEDAVLVDSIIEAVSVVAPHYWKTMQLENCNVYKDAPSAQSKNKPTGSWFTDPPLFPSGKDLVFDPSPKCAAGKRNVGCRYTPEMHEMAKRMQVLAKRGVYKP